MNFTSCLNSQDNSDSLGIYAIGKKVPSAKNQKVPSAYHLRPLILFSSVVSVNILMFSNLWINFSCLSPFGKFSSKDV